METTASGPGDDGAQGPATGTEAAPYSLQVSALSDAGPAREHNEDRCGYHHDEPAAAVVAVADGVSSYVAGEIASQMAVDLTLSGYRAQDPGARLEVRLARAAQQANIEIHDRALVVPELRGMATTLTAAAVVRGRVAIAHVGDSRVYLVRGGRAVQLTKDHRASPTVLTRCVGRELIAAIDRITRPLEQGDALVLCTDGLHGVLSDDDIARLAGGVEPSSACRALVGAALDRRAQDNVTAAIIRMVGPRPQPRPARGVGARLRRLIGRAG